MPTIIIYKDTLTYVTHWTLESFAYGPFKSMDALEEDVRRYVKRAAGDGYTVPVAYA